MKKKIAIVFIAFASTLIYAFGLSTLLTPSAAEISLVQLLVFVLAPCIALGACAYVAESRPVKTLLGVQALVFWGFGIWLIYQQVTTA